MKRFFVALATLTLAVTLMSCGGVKLENTIWKGSDDGFNYELSFTKKRDDTFSDFKIRQRI